MLSKQGQGFHHLLHLFQRHLLISIHNQEVFGVLPIATGVGPLV